MTETHGIPGQIQQAGSLADTLMCNPHQEATCFVTSHDLLGVLMGALHIICWLAATMR